MLQKLSVLLSSTVFISSVCLAQANNEEAPAKQATEAEKAEVYNEKDDEIDFSDSGWKFFVMDKVGLTASEVGVGGEASLSAALFSLDVLGLKEEGGELKEQPFPVIGLGYTIGTPKFSTELRYHEVTLDFLLLSLGIGRHFHGSEDVGRQVTVHVYAPYLYPKYPVSIFARNKFEDGEETKQIFGISAKVSISSIFFGD